MWNRAICLGILFAVLGIAGTAAQEGHPLTGTWIGDWGPSTAQRNHITLVMAWDGAKVTGVLNPGPESAPLGSVFVDYTSWTVRIEAEAKDATGKPVRIQAEGRIEDLASPRRRLTGTWSQGGIKGDFRVTRD
jgi:hypothetical protein